MPRYLDIGPGGNPAKGFETLDAVPGPLVTHVGRAEAPPFPDNTFDIVHASHVIEHVQWYDVEKAIKQWVRILKSGGTLEVWCPNGHALMKWLLHLEETGEWIGPSPGTWKSELIHGDPYKWGVGRLLNYPKKGGKVGGFWLHRAIITPNYLKRIMAEAGLKDIRDMSLDEIRGKAHRAINMGVCGVKS